MKILLAALLLIPSIALAAGNDLLINQRNAADSATLTRPVAPPSGGGINGIFGYSGPTNLPVYFRIGQGLSVESGALISPADSWSSITGKPSFSPVATTGAYGDLTGLPLLFSGAYADLSGKPEIPAAQQRSDWSATSGVTSIANKPSLSTVAVSGAYADLLGKPSLFNGAYSSLTGVPATFTPAPHNQAWGTITGTPTTTAGYGITDAVTPTTLSASLSGYATTSALNSGLSSKFNSPSGTTSQYVRGDGSLAVLPASSGGTVTSVTAGSGLSGGTITTSGTISLPNTGTAGTYANVTTDAQGRVTSGTTITQGAATRALNTAFQVSATRTAMVSYSVQITVTASIAGGQAGDVVLEIASDSAFTANVQTVAITGLGQTYTLAIALQGVQPQTGVVSGVVPAGYYARLRTVNTTGSPAFAYRAGQEVML